MVLWVCRGVGVFIWFFKRESCKCVCRVCLLV